MTPGDIIRERREALGITLRALADAVDVSAPFLSHVERGMRRLPDAVAARIATALELDVNALIRQPSRFTRDDVVAAYVAAATTFANLEHDDAVRFADKWIDDRLRDA